MIPLFFMPGCRCCGGGGASCGSCSSTPSSGYQTEITMFADGDHFNFPDDLTANYSIFNGVHSFPTRVNNIGLRTGETTCGWISPILEENYVNIRKSDGSTALNISVRGVLYWWYPGSGDPSPSHWRIAWVNVATYTTSIDEAFYWSSTPANFQCLGQSTMLKGVATMPQDLTVEAVL